MPAELCINIDVTDGLTNGIPCIIKKLDFRVEGSNRCSIVSVSFHNSDIGNKIRKQFSHLYKYSIPLIWTPILEITRKFKYNYYYSFQVTRRQFPITLGAAKTIHKAQGCTLSSAVIQLGTTKIEHMHYVALSRVQNLSSLYLLDFSENVKISNAVLEEISRLRLLNIFSKCDHETFNRCSEKGISCVHHNTTKSQL